MHHHVGSPFGLPSVRRLSVAILIPLLILLGAGHRCTGGGKIRRDFVPDVTATVQARLAAAGALCLGGLNMSEFAVGPTGHNIHYGACRNACTAAGQGSKRRRV